MMMKNLFFLFFMFGIHAVNAQTFSGAGGAIPGTSTTQTCFPVTVTGIGVIDAVTIGLAQVCINITHPNDDELEIVLRSPDGTIIPLSIQNGGTGNNYTGTCFTATATQSIKFGTAPFSGSFFPEGHLGAVNNGQNANGVWNLCVQDRRTAGNAGSLTNFSITFSNAPAPLPPAFPPCATTLPGTSSCANATTICDFSGLCGNTSGTTVQDWAGSGLNSCFGIENNSFVKFIASASTASFSVWVPTNTIAGNYNLGGIQMLFFSGTCNSGAVTTYGCYPHIYPYSAPGVPLVSVVAASGLTPGNTYYLMIDGFNGDKCTFTIEALSGVSFLNISPAAPIICQGQNVSLTASGGDGSYSWSPAATLSASTGTTVTATPASTTTYTVASTGVGSCAITKDVTVTVNLAPVISTQPSLVVQNVCLNGVTTSLNVAGIPGSGTISGYQWYSNITASTTGGTLIPGATMANYIPLSTATGTFYYYCIITNSNSCAVTSTVSAAININAAVVAPTATVTQQPTCALQTGTILVTAPTAANIQYSIGGAYQSSGTFTGLVPNNYNVTAQNIVTGCTSIVSFLTVNAIPVAPATPTASVTVQPSCALPGGTIVVTAPAGANIQYSIGGAYQNSGTFTGLAANIYNVTVKDVVTGCISSVLTLTVNAAPGAPATPTATVTVQPTCTTTTGTINITAPVAANIQYSLGGAYQVSGTFTGLAPNTYNVTAQDMVTGCISAVLVLTVNAVPVGPATPTATVTVQPSCIVSTGTIMVTAPSGAGIQYSIGGAYQSSGTFTGLTPNTYNVTAKDNLTGCISTVLTLTVNAVPLAPAAPTATVTVQPTCIVATGTIVVIAPTGANIQYSIGAAYQSSGTFSGLAANTYNVTVKDIITGCISPATALTVNPVAGAPAAPTVSLTIQPTCAIPTGTITVTAPTGTSIQYSIGTAYQSSGIFTGLAPNTYTVTAKDINTGCISTGSSVIVNAVPGLPSAPVTNSVSRCGPGIVDLTATGTGTLTWYTDIALANQVASGTNFSPAVNNTTTYYVIATNNNCSSASSTVSATVNALPAPNLGNDKSICTGENVVLNPGVFSSYLWQDNSTGPVFTAMLSNTYTVTVTNSLGCKNTASVKVNVFSDCNDIYFPSAFTPNADFINNDFGPLPLRGLSLVKDYKLSVFNRYGQVVFESSDPCKKWAGRFLGVITTGNYTWIAAYTFKGIKKVKKGNIILLK